MQKSDLHILFPVEPRINSIRGNLKLADVFATTNESCPGTRKGRADETREIFFEPPDSHKGNAARALFYFSVRYQLKIDATEETSLRRWHALDPVDQEEINRHESIFRHQKVRNPFIDYPELANQISDF